jgi:hypothetical protein
MAERLIGFGKPLRLRSLMDEPGSKITPDHAGLLDGAWSSSTR